MVKLAIVNRSKALADDWFFPVVAALQRQVHEHFAPIWKIDAALGFVPSGEEAPPDQWQQIIVDRPDDPGALGYHEATPRGCPIGYTSVEASILGGTPVSSVISHELLEMLVDPWIFSIVRMPDGRFTWLECADACQANLYLMTTESGVVVEVSDFLTPRWFGAPAEEHAPYSFLGANRSMAGTQSLATRPFALAPGGYMGVINADGSNEQITARRDPGRAELREVPPMYSRRWQRIARCENRS